uniref:Uncharacterized protein n=1 Tax=Physcomitrium patens TaxID=3218 RepID=A0A2K1IRG3_PHYPA|nr:hypothetical protein PHYPA_025988 [Physcomitrium patens]
MDTTGIHASDDHNWVPLTRLLPSHRLNKTRSATNSITNSSPWRRRHHRTATNSTTECEVPCPCPKKQRMQPSIAALTVATRTHIEGVMEKNFGIIGARPPHRRRRRKK